MDTCSSICLRSVAEHRQCPLSTQTCLRRRSTCSCHYPLMLCFAKSAETKLAQRGVAFANQWLSKHLISFAPEDDPEATEAVGHLVDAASKEGISRTELEQVGDLNAFIINAWLASPGATKRAR